MQFNGDKCDSIEITDIISSMYHLESCGNQCVFSPLFFSCIEKTADIYIDSHHKMTYFISAWNENFSQSLCSRRLCISYDLVVNPAKSSKKKTYENKRNHLKFITNLVKKSKQSQRPQTR